MSQQLGTFKIVWKCSVLLLFWPKHAQTNLCINISQQCRVVRPFARAGDVCHLHIRIFVTTKRWCALHWGASPRIWAWGNCGETREITTQSAKGCMEDLGVFVSRFSRLVICTYNSWRSFADQLLRWCPFIDPCNIPLKKFHLIVAVSLNACEPLWTHCGFCNPLVGL